MRKLFVTTMMITLTVWVFASEKPPKDLFDNFINGDPEIKSINAMVFGPEGILFIGDSKSAMIFAIDTKDNLVVAVSEAINIQNIDQKIASALGTTVDNIIIRDMAVNPVSKVVYLAVENGAGNLILLTIKGEDFEPVDLTDISYSTISLSDPIAEDAQDRRGRSMRVWAISDIGYYNNQVLVSGLSNQEFGSTFRSIPFPFDEKQDYASLEIYHAAHAQYETHAPIKTFTSAEINGESYIVASYTCTPLVLFPMNSLKPGEHVMGKTVGEFGNGNTPLDIITMEKDGQSYFLMANSNRPVMKVKYADVAVFEDYLTEPVTERSATAGVDFISLPMVNVLQLDKLDDTQFVMLQRTSSGDLNLRTANNRWL